MKEIIKCLLSVFLYTVSISGYAQSYEVTVPKAGKLSSQIKTKKENIVSLKVQGEINSSDISYIRNLPNLEVLNLSKTKLVEGGKSFEVQIPISINSRMNPIEKIKTEIYGETKIPKGCFSGLEKLKVIELPANIKWIEDAAFYNCSNLSEVTIHGEVSIKSNIFDGCSNLSVLAIAGKIRGLSNDKIPLQQVTLMGEIDVSYSNWKNIESLFEGFNPRYIFFQKENLRALYNNFGSNKIEEGVHIIWDQAFNPNYSLGGRGQYAYKDMTSITIPNTVIAIGYRAFCSCSNLSQVKFSSNLQVILDEAFSYCNLSEVELSSIEYIGKEVFQDNKQLRECLLGNKLETIGERAFSNCRILPTITLPETVTYIGEDAFRDCIYNHRTTKTNQKYPSVNL